MKYLDYNEKRQHGEPDFPIKLYNCSEGKYRYLMDPHWHKELEIIRIISGEFDIYINNTNYLLKKGDIAFVNCNFLHRGTPKNCEYECILCNLDIMAKKNYRIYSKYINPVIISSALISPILHSDNSDLYSCVLKLYNLLGHPTEFYELTVLSCLFELFERLYRDGYIKSVVESKKSIAKAATVAQLIHWIDNNFTEHITLSTLSEMVEITPNHLCKVFREYIGKTPVEYINTVRVENACHELRQGGKSITQIALDSGFNDISYFCRIFKKITGVSAKAYK